MRHLILIASILCTAAVCDAQVFAAPVLEASTQDDGNTGFQFETNAKLQDHLIDFRRHADRGLFEKAIEVLDRLEETPAEGLLESDEGLLLPATEQVWRLQSQMNGELREAFRIFLNAKAKKEFSEARDGIDGSEESLAGLRRVYQRYFVSSVGDEATNLLGDAAFRRGDFRRAVRLYRDILDYHPDSDLQTPWILFKLGLAHDRAGEFESARRISRTLQERHAGETVRFAGRDVDAAAELETLLTPDDAPPPTNAAAADSEHGSIPEELRTIWRHQFLAEKDLATLRQSEQNYYYKGAAHFIPPTAVLGNTLAFNYYGAVSALDVRTGKLSWVDTKPAESITKMSQNFYGLTTDAYDLTAGGDGDSAVFVSLAVPPDRFNYWRVGSEMTTFRVDDGRELFSTGGSNRGQSEWYHLGTPLVVPNRTWRNQKTYVVAVKTQGATEAFLRIFTGRQPREIRLGRFRGVQMDNYQGRSLPNPILAVDPEDEDSILILLDEGLLLAYSLDGDEVRWGLRLPTPPKSAGGPNQGPGVANTLHPKSSLIIDRGIAYVKDGLRATVSAIDLASRSLVWQRRIDPMSEVVAVDGPHVYLLSQEMSALDREDGRLVWSVPLPIENGGLSTVLLEETAAVFTGRGLYELGRSDGALRRIHRGVEADSSGGRLLRVGERLVTVSEKCVTAYALADYDAEAVQAEVESELKGANSEADANNEEQSTESVDE